mmetsp:Transcript_43850/g.89579  ORF Transcript_43850/g.89579 Transcript_43850/m.89579 type:complete len:99 (-) Transcript_43850:455-751(-)
MVLMTNRNCEKVTVAEEKRVDVQQRWLQRCGIQMRNIGGQGKHRGIMETTFSCHPNQQRMAPKQWSKTGKGSHDQTGDRLMHRKQNAGFDQASRCTIS